jgi:hypothetical protein
VKPGPKPKGKISRKWSPELAYAVGLITADGCLSSDGRHINFTSTDLAQVLLFKQCLGLVTKTSTKHSGTGSMAYYTQFGDVLFYEFLLDIGLFPAKSNTLGAVDIPEEYFSDFTRGYFDGDGSSYLYFDPKFQKSFRFYVSFTSGSKKYLSWFRKRLTCAIGIKGYFSYNKNNLYVQLKYSKKEAIIFSEYIYKTKKDLFLKRKHLKTKKALDKIDFLQRSKLRI